MVTVSVNTLLEGKTIFGLDHATVRCFYKDQEFFIYRQTVNRDSIINFFMPYMPFEPTMILNFNRTMKLQISLEEKSQEVFSKTFEIEVSEERGFYRISQWGCLPRPMPP